MIIQVYKPTKETNGARPSADGNADLPPDPDFAVRMRPRHDRHGCWEHKTVERAPALREQGFLILDSHGSAGVFFTFEATLRMWAAAAAGLHRADAARWARAYARLEGVFSGGRAA